MWITLSEFIERLEGEGIVIDRPHLSKQMNAPGGPPMAWSEEDRRVRLVAMPESLDWFYARQSEIIGADRPRSS